MDPDRALVQAAQQGDADAVDGLVRKYQVRMFNFARALTGNDADAEDLAQESFIRACRGLTRFRGESSFKNWLYRIATNVARSHRAKQTRQSPMWDQRLEAGGVAEAYLTADEVDAEDSAIRRQALDRALLTLPEEQRLPVVLHDVEGLEYKEIAVVLDVPIGTVMSRIFRGRQRLRPLLAEHSVPATGVPAAPADERKVAL